MRRFLIFVALIAGYLVFEVLSWLYIAYGLGIDESDYSRYYRNSNPNRAIITWADRYERHPYVGYVMPHRIREIERFRDQEHSDEYVIAILGGSVAEHFADYVIDEGRYFDELRNSVPGMEGRSTRILNLALGGYKQPQQFILARYLLEDLDMTINIEGFNEIVSLDLNPVYPTDFPMASLKFYERKNSAGIYMALGRLATSAYKFLDDLPARSTIISESNVYFLVWRGVQPLLYQGIRELEERYLAAIGAGEAAGSDPAASRRRKIEIWKKYTRLQKQVTRSAGVLSFFFLQPNQYLKGAKPLSQEEWSIAINPERIEAGNTEMKLLRAAAHEMRTEGLPVYDLTGIFGDDTETVYEDACCHLNELGNQIMAEEILGIIQRDAAIQRGTIAHGP